MPDKVNLTSHGLPRLTFLSGYTYSHALGDGASGGTNSGTVLPTDKNNLFLNYGSISTDLRHRFTFSPTYAIPGMKSPAQMLEGWSLSGILVLQSGSPWTPVDSTSNDWLGTGENASLGNATGVTQYWNYSGPRSAFDNTGPNPIPCYNGISGKEAGCTSLAATPATIQQDLHDGRSAVVKTQELKPDIAILDIGMPSLNGLDATKQIVKVNPHTKVCICHAPNDLANDCSQHCFRAQIP